MNGRPQGMLPIVGEPGSLSSRRHPRNSAALVDLAIVATIGAASRLLSLGLLALSYAVWPGSGVPVAGLGGRPFAVWDGAWYVSIAETGYHAASLAQGVNGPFYDIAFFPAWPALMAVASVFGWLPTATVGGLLANVLFIVACPLIFWVTRTYLDRHGAFWTVAFVAFSPAAYVFSLGYAESLFVLLAAWAFARPTVVPVALAQLARLTGFAVGVGLALEAWMAGRRRSAAAFVLVPIVVSAGWFVAVALITGRPDGYILGTPSWYQSTGSSYGPGTLLQTPIGAAVAAYVALLALGCLAIFRRAPGMAVCATLLVVAAFVLGRWESMPRYVLPAFPAVAGVALMVDGRWRRLAILTSFVLGQVFLTMLVARELEAP